MALTVVLLAGGYATRLHPLTKRIPKTLLPLRDGVILDEVVKAVDGVRGVTKRILVTNHSFAAQFRVWQRSRRQSMQIIDDGTRTPRTRLGAIRDLELARTKGRARGDLLVVGTDNLFDWSLDAFVSRARRHRPAPSVALWQAPSRRAARQFGVVRRDRRSRLTAFVEKSPHPPSRDVALCVYYFPAAVGRRIRRFLSEGGNADAPGYFIQWLARTGDVYGMLMRGLWYDIGTLKSYQHVVNTWGRPRFSTRPHQRTPTQKGGRR